MKLLQHLAGNVWTYIGAGFVLMTVTGDVRRTGIILTIIGVVIESVAVITEKDGDK
jgi:membrane associated rhomboid family serine protease